MQQKIFTRLNFQKVLSKHVFQNKNSALAMLYFEKKFSKIADKNA